MFIHHTSLAANTHTLNSISSLGHLADTKQCIAVLLKLLIILQPNLVMAPSAILITKQDSYIAHQNSTLQLRSVKIRFIVHLSYRLLKEPNPLYLSPLVIQQCHILICGGYGTLPIRDSK